MWQKHRMDRHSPKRASLALAITLAASGLLAFARPGLAQEATDAAAGSVPAAADEIADIFSKVGDQLYDECIFELSDEQVEVQAALIQSYIQQGAESAMARKLAAAQIQPPKLSEKCEQVRKEAGCRSSTQTRQARRARPCHHACEQEGVAAVGLRRWRRLRNHSHQGL
jgi:hypothetical protein